MFRTWNMKFLDFWQQSFHPGCQSCTLLVYMNSLWDVGVRSDINWRETLSEPWRKLFDLFVKTALYVSKGILWVKKKQLLKILIFLQALQVFERTFTVLDEKIFGKDIKIENCSLRLKGSIKKPNFWKFWFFFKLFRFLNEHSPCLAKKFSAGISNLKIAVFVSKVQSKNQTSEGSLFFQILQNFHQNLYRAWRKTFRQGYQNWKLQSSSHKIKQKIKLLKNRFFFKIFRTLNEHLPCLAKKFWAGVSIMKIVLFVFRVSIWG